MKKAYSKPMLLCEDFRLSQSVAYGCTTGQGLNANLRSSTECIIQIDSMVTLFSSTPTCEATVEDIISSCYNNPGDGYHPFAS